MSIFIFITWLFIGAHAATEGDVSPSATETLATPKAPTVNFGLAMDLQYSGGGPDSQGFSLPLARLSLDGDVTPSLAYRFALGQTREFSTALLPQMLPTEAFVDVYSADQDTSPALMLRAGMFTPSFNPWWSPDLSRLTIPKYAESHRALFLNRDVGGELKYLSPHRDWELGIGTCNGSGILSLNANNAKAVTAFGQYQWKAGELQGVVGLSGYWATQSVPQSLNYREAKVFNAYVGFTGLGPLELQIEGFQGAYRDSVRELEPKGYSAMGRVAISDELAIFSRWEYLSENPIDGNEIRGLMAGPYWKISSAFFAYLYYEKLTRQGTTEESFQARTRFHL